MQEITRLEDDLKRRKIVSSHIVAEKLINLFDNFIRSELWDAPSELLP